MGFSHQAIYMDLSHLKGEEYMVDDRILALIEGEEAGSFKQKKRLRRDLEPMEN